MLKRFVEGFESVVLSWPYLLVLRFWTGATVALALYFLVASFASPARAGTNYDQRSAEALEKIAQAEADQAQALEGIERALGKLERCR